MITYECTDNIINISRSCLIGFDYTGTKIFTALLTSIACIFIAYKLTQWTTRYCWGKKP